MSTLKTRIENLKTNNQASDPFTYNYSVKKMEDFLNTKVVDMYDRPWQKLEESLKINKIKEYLKDQNLSETEYILQLENLSKAVKHKLLKSTHIKYANCKIEWIKL